MATVFVRCSPIMTRYRKATIQADQSQEEEAIRTSDGNTFTKSKKRQKTATIQVHRSQKEEAFRSRDGNTFTKRERKGKTLEHLNTNTEIRSITSRITSLEKDIDHNTNQIDHPIITDEYVINLSPPQTKPTKNFNTFDTNGTQNDVECLENIQEAPIDTNGTQNDVECLENIQESPIDTNGTQNDVECLENIQEAPNICRSTPTQPIISLFDELQKLAEKIIPYEKQVVIRSKDNVKSSELTNHRKVIYSRIVQFIYTESAHLKTLQAEYIKSMKRKMSDENFLKFFSIDKMGSTEKSFTSTVIATIFQEMRKHEPQEVPPLTNILSDDMTFQKWWGVIGIAALELMQNRNQATTFYTFRRNKNESQKHRKILDPNIRALMDYIYWLSTQTNAVSEGVTVLSGMGAESIFGFITEIVDGATSVSEALSTLFCETDIRRASIIKEKLCSSLCRDIVSAIKKSGTAEIPKIKYWISSVIEEKEGLLQERPSPFDDRFLFSYFTEMSCCKKRKSLDSVHISGRKKMRTNDGKIIVSSNLKSIYFSMDETTGSLGGNGHGGPIYGELTCGSFQKIVDLLKLKANFNKASKFIDVGCGLGKPSIHVAADPGVQFSYGIEVVPIRWLLGMLNAKAVLQRHTSNICGKFFLDLGDILEARTFDPFTHIYMFDIG